jgi:hypothetical protein
MTIPQYKFGDTTVAKVKHSSDLRQLFLDPWLKSENIIIKPNWVSTDPGEFSDAQTLRTLFEALDGRIFVTESYCLLRSMNLLKEGMHFTAGDRDVNWKWLLKGDGWNWLIENPGWDWFKRDGHWEQLKKEDQAFRDKYGFTDLFEEFDVTYINVTEEVWNERIADPNEIKRTVESRFRPVQVENLYSMVPAALYNLRGSTFISCARLKMYASFTMKNLFGMIPDPARPWWHGPDGNRITQSILDINKVYHSLFNLYGICEALTTSAYTDPDGQYEGVYTGRYNLAEGTGFVAFGRDLVSIDTLLLDLSDPAKRWIADLNRDSVAMAQEEFGTVDRSAIEQAKKNVKHWISP